MTNVMQQKWLRTKAQVHLSGLLGWMFVLAGVTGATAQPTAPNFFADPPPLRAPAMAKGGGIQTLGTGAGWSEVDLMVVYTAVAKTNAGGTSGINALVDAAVAEANRVMINSEAGATFRLVYRGEAAGYTETGTNDLSTLQDPAGALSAVHALRITYQADMVCMITEAMPTTNMTGSAYIMETVSGDFSASAFSVVKRSALTNGNYAMVHELGHNFGCQHDQANAAFQGAYPYAYGYNYIGSNTTNRTVMAVGEGQRIGYFSNPNLTNDGFAIGTPTNNNALCISNTAPTVAGFYIAQPMFQFASNSLTLLEDAGTVTITVLRSGPTNVTKNVSVSFVNQTASNTLDYVGQAATLTFAAGETNKTVTFTIRTDNLVEADETFLVVLTNNASATLLGPDATLTVTLLESKAGLAWSSTAVSAVEPSANGTNTATLTVQRSGYTNLTNTVVWTTVNGTAQAGINYLAASGTLTLDPGVLSTNVSIQILNDGLAQGTLQFTLALSGSNAATLLLNTNATVSLLDSDAIFQFATNMLSVSEANTNANLTVLRIGGTNTEMTVSFVTTNGTATNGVRYTGGTQTVTFLPGIATMVVAVPLINDTLVNGDQTFSAKLSNASTGVVGSVSNCTVTIRDEDVLVGWVVTNQTMLETAALTNFTVYRVGVTTATHLVTYTFPTGTITNDFIGRSGTLTFTPGVTSKTVAFQPRANNTIQANRDVIVQLGVTAVAGVPYLENSNLVITLLESKSAVRWGSTNEAVTKPAEGVTNWFSLALVRTGNTNQTTQVSVTTVEGTAHSNFVTGAAITTTNAYTAIQSMVMFAPGDTIATVRVAVVGNGQAQGDLHFSATLSTNNNLVVTSNLVVNGTFEAGTNAWIITGGDGDNGVSTNVGNPGGAYQNGSASLADCYQDLATVPGNAYTISFDVAFAPDVDFGDYLEVTFGTNSLLTTPDTAGLFQSRAFTNVLAIDFDTPLHFLGYVTASGWLIDNVVVQDTTPVVVSDPVTLLLNTNVALSISDATVIYYFATNAVSVSETNANVNLTVWCAGNTNVTNFVSYATANDTAMSGVRYKAKSGTLAFAPGVSTQTVQVLLYNSALVNGDQTFLVKLTNASPGELRTPSNCTVTVLDKDVEIGWVVTNRTIMENAGPTSLAVYRRGMTSGTYQVSYTFPSGAIASDFVASSGTLTFEPGVTNLSVAFQPVLNDVIQSNRAVAVQLALLNAVAGVPSLANSNLLITLVESKSGVAWSPTSLVVDEPAQGVTTNLLLTLVRSGYTNQSTRVIVDTVDGTALSNIFTMVCVTNGASTNFVYTLTTTNNYTATNGTVTFAPGVTNLSVWVALLGNGVAQGTRQFNVQLWPAATNDVVVNGSFTVGWNPWTTPVGAVFDAYYQAYANFNTIDASGDFYQDLATVSGRTYTVSFDLMKEDAAGSLELVFGGVSLPVPTTTIGFENVLFSEVATSAVTRLNFRGYGETVGWFIHNVQVLDSVLIPGTDVTTVLLNTNDTVIVRDYDQSYQFATNALSVFETSGSVTLTVRRIGKTNDSSSVDFKTQDLPPLDATRFVATNCTLSFNTGSVTRTVQVAISNDAAVNGNHTFLGVLTNAGASRYDACDVTIMDDEVELGWAVTNVTLLENAAVTNLVVYRVGGATITNLVNYTFPTGTITNDFIARSGTLTFNPGDTSKSVAFQPRLNNVIQTNRFLTVQLALTNAVAEVTRLGNSNLVITLVESKAGVAWSVTNAFVTEPARGVTNQAALTLIRSGNTNLTTPVNYATYNDTAYSNLFGLVMVTNGVTTNYVYTLITTNNYTATNGVVVFAPGVTNLDVLVDLVGNGRPEGDKLFNVLLDNSTSTLFSNNVATNGTFDAGTNFWTFLNGDTNSGVVVTNGNPGSAYFNGNTNQVSADFYQDLETTSNHVYTFTFDVKMVEPTNSALLQVFFGDALLLTTPNATNGFTNFVFRPTATAAVTRINFRGYGNTNGWFIDNVQARDTTPFIGSDSTTVLINPNEVVTVQDSDAVYQFTTNAVSVAETNLAVTLIVQRLYSTSSVSSVGYDTLALTASNGVRYLTTNGTLTFAAGVVTQAVTVTLIDDTLVNGAQNFRVRLGIIAGGTLGTASNCLVTVQDNDVEIRWAVTNLALLENAGVNNLVVYRTGVTSATNLVNYAFPIGVITNDFIARNGTLTFQPGDTSQAVPFQTSPNNVIQADRMFNARLTLVDAVAGVPYLANTNLGITIMESKAAVAWTPDSVTHTKPAQGATNSVSLTLIRTGNTNQTTQVSFVTTNGTASSNVYVGASLTATNGYTATNGVVTFVPGNTNLSVSVEVVGDGLVQASKLFYVVLSTNNTLIASPTNDLVTNGTFDLGAASWTMVSDASSGVSTNVGTPPGSAYTNAALTSRDLYQDLATITGHTYAITFDYLTSGATYDLSVFFGGTLLATNTELGSATFAGTNFTQVATNTTTRISFGGTSSDGFWAIDNVHVRDISGIVIADPVTLLLNTNATVALQDDTVLFQFANTNLSVSETNGSVDLIVQRVGNATSSVSVALSFVDLSAVNGVRYTAAGQTVTFGVGVVSQIVQVAISNNVLADGNVRFRAVLSNAPVGSILGTDSNCVVTIIDNDVEIGWVLPTNRRVLENAGQTSLLVYRTGVTNGTSYVDYVFPTGAITNDFVAQSGTLTFEPNVVSQSVLFTPVENSLIQTDRTVIVSLSVTSESAGVPYLANTNLVITLAESKSGVAWRRTSVDWTEPAAGVTNWISLSLARTGNTNQTAQVFVTTDDGSAISNVVTGTTITQTNNYNGINGTVTFAPGVTNATVLVTFVGNGLAQETRWFSVNLSTNYLTASVAGNVVSNGTFDTGTNGWILTPADAACGWSADVGNSAGSYTNASQGSTNADFYQVLTTTPGHAYLVSFDLKNVATNGDSAQVYFDGTKLLDTTQVASFQHFAFTQVVAGASAQIKFSGYGNTGAWWAVDNVVVQDISAFKVEDPATVLLNSNVIMTVLDSDARFRFAPTTLTVSETNGTATLMVMRDGATNSSMTVGFATVNGSATNGVRFVGATGTVTFAAGATSQVVQVTLINDTQVNGDQTFRVALLPPLVGTIGAGSNCAVTVIDEDVEIGWLVTSLTLRENAPATNLVVYRSGVTTATDTVNYSFPTGSITNDFLAVSGTLTFAPGVTNMLVAFQPLTNNVIQPDQTVLVQLTLTNAVQGVPYLANSDLVITLVEYKAGLAWNPASLTVLEPAAGETNTVTLSVQRTGNADQTNIVAWATVGGTASNDVNYRAASGTLTLDPGVLTADVSVQIINDGLVQGACRFAVALSNVDASAALLLNTNINVTILEGAALFQFTSGTLSESETNGTATVIVERLGNTNMEMTVAFATADGTASNGVRYTATTGTVTFALGVVTQAVTVPLINNTRVDGAQDFTVLLSNASTGVFGVASNCVVTVQDNDVEIRWAVTSLTLREDAGTTNLVVYRTGVTNDTNYVTYTFPTNGTITSDFVASSGTLTFLPGVTNLTVPFLPSLNNVIQTNRAVVATLTVMPLAGVPYLGNTNLVITITESKAGLVWLSSDVSVDEPSSATTTNTATLTVVRSGNTNQTSSVAWTTLDGTASNSVNYLAASGTLTLLPGVRSNSVSIDVIYDSRAIGLQRFTVALSNVDDTAAVLLTTNATVSVFDGSTMFQFVSNNVSVSETNRTVLLMVERIGASNSIMTVRYATANGSATSGVHYANTSGTLSFAANEATKTFSVAITNNYRVDGDKTFSVNLSNASTGSVGSACDVTIIDDDVAYRWAVTNLTLLESADPTNLVVYRDGSTAKTNVVKYTFPTGTITNDFIARTGYLTFLPGVTSTNFVFQPRTNNVIQTNRAVTVTLSPYQPVANGPYLRNTNLVITLVESKAGLKWLSTAVYVREPDVTAMATVTVVRTANTNLTSIVEWTTVDGTATNAGNYTAASGTLTWLPGELTNTVAIEIKNDGVAERDTVQFLVALTNFDPATSALVNTNVAVYVFDAASAFQFTTNAVTSAETNRNVTLIVKRVGSTSSTQYVGFATANGSADTNRYIATNGTLTFVPGVVTQGVRVVLINNRRDNGPTQTFTVNLTNAVNGALGAKSNCVVTLLDNGVVIGWSVTSHAMLENAAATNLAVYRSVGTNGTNIVNYRFYPITGTLTNDFFARSGTLTFRPGETINTNVIFQPRPNDVLQTNRVINALLSLSTLDRVPYLADSNLVITLQDTKVGLGWATNAVTVSELSQFATNTVKVWVKRTGNPNLTNTVAWATSDGTARDGISYIASSGTLTMDGGTLSNSVDIQIIGDEVAQGPRTFRVALSNVDDNVSLLVTNATVTVLDSDAVFQFATTNVSFSETNAYATLVVRRAGVTNGSIKVGFVTASGTATNRGRYFTTNGTLTFASGVVTQSLRVALTNNVRVDGDQDFGVSLYTIGSTGLIGTASNCTVTVQDDDIEIGWAVTNLALLENAGSTLLSIYRRGVTNRTAAVTYAFPTGTITNDFLARSGTLTFKAGEINRTVPFLPLPNRVIQTNRMLSARLSVAPLRGVPYLGNSNLVITLMESKAAVAWSMTNTAWSSTNRTLAATNTIVMEPAAGVTNWVSLRLTRTGNTNQATQVSFATTNGTALSNLVFGTITTNIIAAYTNTIENEDGSYTDVFVPSTNNIVIGTATTTNNYMGTNGMVTFEPGVTNMDVLVGLVGNGLAQGWMRQFTVRLTTNNNLVATTTNNVVTNGTFATGLAGWTLSQPVSLTIGFVDAGGNPDGAFMNGVSSDEPADLYQDLSTIPGHSYVISFDLWHGTNPQNPLNDDYVLDVSFGGSNVFSSSETVIPAGVYTSCLATQVAVTATNRLSFYGSDNMGYWYIDNVRVQDESVVIVADPVTILLNTNATVGVRDYDVGVQFATNRVSVSETNRFVSLIVQRAGDTNLTNTVRYVTADGSATNGLRYLATNGTLRFLPGVAAQTVQVWLVNNVLADGNQSFSVTLTNGTGAATATNCTVTVLSDDTTIGWGVTNLTIMENSGSNNLAVYRWGVTNGTNVISYTFPTGSITNDFIARSGTLTFKPNETNKFVSFTPRLNNVIQTNRTVVVRLAKVSQLGSMMTYLTSSNLVISLIEAKAGFAWVPNAYALPEPAAGVTNNATLTVQCSGNINQTNTVAWTTKNGSALAGISYVASSGTLTFEPGQSTSDVTIPVIGDGQSSGTQWFTVALTNLDPTVAVLLSTNATVTLQDADTTFQFASSTVSRSETNAAVFLTVQRAGNTNEAMTVNFGTADAEATNGVRYVTTNGMLRFAAGVLTQTVRVALINNTLVDGDQAFTVALSNPSIGILGVNSNCSVTVIDNDVMIGWGVSTLTMYDNLGVTNLTIYRRGITTGTNKVNYVFPTGSITNDFRARSGTITFLPSETSKDVAFQTLPNNVIQTNRLLQVRLTIPTPVPVASYLSTSNLLITLLESKSGVAWSLTNSAMTEAAAGETNWLTLALTRRGNTNQTTQVSFATAAGSASQNIVTGNDITTTNSYTGTNGMVTFVPGVTNASVMVAMVGNGKPEANLQFSLALTTNNALIVSSNLIVNGTFDSGTSAWSCVGGDANGWNPTNGNLGGSYQNASTNSTIVDFYQDVTTVPGNSYAISFDVMNTTVDDDLEVVFGDTTLLSTLATPLDTAGAFQRIAYEAVATNTLTSLHFSGYGNSSCWYIDNVVVMDAVPVVIVDPVIVLLNTNSMVTITNVDVGFTFFNPTASVSETNRTVNLWVRRDGATNETLMVDYATVDGSALADVRYVAPDPENHTLRFDPGVRSQAVVVTLSEPTEVVEWNQSFNVILSSPSFGTLGANTNCEVTIVDRSIAIGWAQTSLLLPGNDFGSHPLTVTRYGNNLLFTNKVSYSFPTGAITNNFTARSGTLTFEPTSALTQSMTVAFAQKANSQVVTDVVVNVRLALVTPVKGAPYLENNIMAITLLKSMATLSWATNAVGIDEPALGVTSPLTLTVERGGVATGTTTVAWSTVDGSATGGVNYVSAGGTLTFTGEEDLSQDIVVDVMGDGVANDTRQFTVTLNNLDATKSMLLTSNVTVSIRDNDTSFQFAPGAVSVSETNRAAILTVRRTGNTNAVSTVSYATEDGSAIDGVRYTGQSDMLTFGVGVVTQTVSVLLTNNTVLDGDQIFYVKLTPPESGAVLGTVSNCQVTVLDNDVQISWATNAVTMVDSAPVTNLWVNRVGATGTRSVVTYTFPSGTGTNDYSTAQSGTLTFLENVASTSVVFCPRENNLVMTNHDVVVRLTVPAGGVPQLVTSNMVIHLIKTKGGVMFTDTSKDEPTGPATNWVSVTLTRVGNTDHTNKVDWATSNGTATAGLNYLTASGTLTMGPGETTTNVTIGILDDRQATDKVFYVVLSSNAGSSTVILQSTGLVTITNRDAAISFAFASNSVVESSNLVLTVSRSGPTNSTVWVAYCTTNGTGLAGTDYEAISGTLTFAPGVMSTNLTVAISNDAVVASNRTFMVLLTNVSYGAALGSRTTNTVTIVDDDCIFWWATTNLTVSERTGTVTLAVYRRGYVSTAASANFDTQNGTATNVIKYLTTNGVVTMAAGVTNGTVQVKIVNNNTFEPLQYFWVVLSAVDANVAVSNAMATNTIWIIEDDARPNPQTRVQSLQAPQVQVSGLRLNANGQVEVLVSGMAVLETTTNLADPTSWQTLGTSTVENLSLSVLDTTPVTERPAARFYRIKK